MVLKATNVWANWDGQGRTDVHAAIRHAWFPKAIRRAWRRAGWETSRSERLGKSDSARRLHARWACRRRCRYRTACYARHVVGDADIGPSTMLGMSSAMAIESRILCSAPSRTETSMDGPRCLVVPAQPKRQRRAGSCRRHIPAYARGPFF